MNDAPKTPTPEEIEARKQEMIHRWEAEVEIKDFEYGKDYSKREYTFSSIEKRRLMQQETIKILADEAMNDILNLNCLPRVGVEPSNEVRVLYDMTIGRFVVWIPKKTGKKPSIEGTSESVESVVDPQ